MHRHAQGLNEVMNLLASTQRERGNRTAILDQLPLKYGAKYVELIWPRQISKAKEQTCRLLTLQIAAAVHAYKKTIIDQLLYAYCCAEKLAANALNHKSQAAYNIRYLFDFELFNAQSQAT